MRTSIILLLATATLVQAVILNHTQAKPHEALSDYGVEEMQGDFKRQFDKHSLSNGTTQDLKSRLDRTGIVQLNPRHRDLPSATRGQEHGSAKDIPSVKLCGAFPAANSHHIAAQVPAIVVISGPAVIGPGPRNCAQVSCAQDSAIWWCNDRNTTVMLPQGTQELGDAVDAITEQCCSTSDCRLSPGNPISGQAFSEDGWNVVVKGDVC